MSFEFDNKFKEISKEIKWIIGVDEAGRGCLAGPVVVGACCLFEGFDVKNVKDSKKFYSDLSREKVYKGIVESDYALCIVIIIDSKDVDNHNILSATMKGMVAASENIWNRLNKTNDVNNQCYVLYDGDKIPYNSKLQGEAVVSGDSKSISIAAASILAKVTRDRLMKKYDEEYPGWDFAKNKGYGTKSHREKITVHNYTPIHRKTFNPLRTLLENTKSMY